MRKNISFSFLLLMLILSACNNEEENSPEDALTNQSDREHSAQILKVETDLEEENGWLIVPKGTSTMTISVEAENVETLLLWIVETGTGTWGERTLIGTDIDGSNGWALKWEFGERIFHDYIVIQALGSDGVTQAKESVNVHSLIESDSK